jgi:hypothetical protein
MVPAGRPSSVWALEVAGLIEIERLASGCLEPSWPRQPEIENLGAPGARHHDVFRLQITVDDAGAVRGSQTVRDLRGEIQRPLRRHGAAPDLFSQRPAINQLGNDERRVAIDGGVEDGHDVGMVQRARRTCFGNEPVNAFRIRLGSLPQNLERDLALQAGIPGPVHVAATPSAQEREDLVRTTLHGGAIILSRRARGLQSGTRARVSARTPVRRDPRAAAAGGAGDEAARPWRARNTATAAAGRV